MTVIPRLNEGKAKEAYRLLNDYVGDLVAGTRFLGFFETLECYSIYENRRSPNVYFSPCYYFVEVGRAL